MRNLFHWILMVPASLSGILIGRFVALTIQPAEYLPFYVSPAWIERLDSWVACYTCAVLFIGIGACTAPKVGASSLVLAAAYSAFSIFAYFFAVREGMAPYGWVGVLVASVGELSACAAVLEVEDEDERAAAKA